MRIFLYCGTHVGQFIPKEGYDEIHLFEPNRNCNIWKHQLRKDIQGKVIPVEKAVWIADGMIEFALLGESDMGSGILGTGRQFGSSCKKILVPCIDFAEYLKGLPQDAYIVCRMDIEGAEHEVLRHLMVTGTIDWIKELHAEFHGIEGDMIPIERYCDTMEAKGIKFTYEA